MNDMLLWIGGLIISPIVSIIIENKFQIIGKLKKAYFYILNKNVGFDVNFTFNEISDFDIIKKQFLEITREKNKINVKKNNNNKLEILFDNYLINVILMPTNQLFIDTSRVECGMREIKNKFNSFLSIINQLENKNKLKVKEASFNIFIPFKWSYVNIRTPKELKLKDYDIKFTEGQYKSIINLRMDKLSISGNERAIHYVLDNFMRLF